MARRILAGLALIASVVAVASASAQAPAATADSGIKGTSAIMRVSLYRVADGVQTSAVIADIQTHLIPIWEAEKKAGIIVGYSTMTNVTASSATDWQFGTVLTYKNFAAMDSLGARTDAITLKHYGSAAARTATNEARGKMRKLVSTNLVNGTTYSRP